MKRFAIVMSLLAIVTATQGQDAQTFAPLPYSFDALEPYIDAKTMEIHYTRHHRAYFDNFTKAVAETDLAGKSLEELFQQAAKLPPAVRNNAGGHYNHTLYWQIMAPQGGGEPPAELATRLTAAFGSVEKFKERFKQAAMGRFGSGWAWLALADDGTLFITSTANQDNPLMDVGEKRGVPLLGLDVWEHAYYLKYQNLRGNYVDAFWHVVNWPVVAKRLQAAQK